MHFDSSTTLQNAKKTLNTCVWRTRSDRGRARGGPRGATRVFLSVGCFRLRCPGTPSWLEVFTVDVTQRTVDSGLQGVPGSCVCTLVLTDAAAHWSNDGGRDDDDVILIGLQSRARPVTASRLTWQTSHQLLCFDTLIYTAVIAFTVRIYLI